MSKNGRNPLWGLAKSQQMASGFGDIVLAATTLSARRVGGLIVIERLQGLRTQLSSGVRTRRPDVDPVGT